MDIKGIQKKLQDFVDERDWDQFHSPKNLAMALAGEAGELLEIFQWLNVEQAEKLKLNGEDKDAVAEEIADICMYLLRLCDKLDIDLTSAIDRKIQINEKKYPVALSKGIATKHNKLEG